MSLFNSYLNKINEYGEVIENSYPIVVLRGLPKARVDELVIFEDGEKGRVFSVGEDKVSIVNFSHKNICVGSKAVRTGQLMDTPVGEEMLGRVVNPFGEIVNGKRFNCRERKSLMGKIKGIKERVKVKKALVTGVSIVDMLIPLGKGQRELVIGDRKTGKTSFLLTTAKKQILSGSVVIYALIGKKREEVYKVLRFFKNEKLMDRTIIVFTSSDDSPGLIYLTPYTAMTIGEYFRDKGKDSLVILDDLSSHARFYREISLIGKSFPGRDSYPGDIFYTHARLIERGGNFVHPQKKSVSISCLPVIETIEGDLTDYIATNIMSMTDGHIYFNKDNFLKGERPAVDVLLSVSRVGKQVQSPLKREINQKLISFITTFQKMKNLSRFGNELSDEAKKILKRGEIIFRYFYQDSNFIIPDEINIVFFALIWGDMINLNKVSILKKNMLCDYKKNTRFYQLLSEANSLEELLNKIGKNKDKLFKLISQNE